MLRLAHVSDLLPRNHSRKCLQSLHIRHVHAACFVIYGSNSSMILFSSEIFMVLLLWWYHLLVTVSSATALKRELPFPRGLKSRTHDRLSSVESRGNDNMRRSR